MTSDVGARPLPKWDWEKYAKDVLTVAMVLLGVLGLLAGKLTGGEAVDLIKRWSPRTSARPSLPNPSKA